ncbi:hypothetical protein FOZ62_028200 [Perkinsus olseni]|uniref:SLC12A transporter C-terminal domain-containing protein n=1 Tax=Perkinsus olseni TaxID=32597 RepID=A0A7J6S5X1_PEROL|nr:hypothetical protein FOZ62_028200 [Perkinsus olseni]
MIGNLDLIAPLLTMCFLVCYAFMNVSCLMLTLLKTPTWRPAGIFRRRFRLWYILSSFVGVVAALAVMIIVSVYWTIGVLVLAALLYLYLDWVGAEAEWGSGFAGLRYNFALTALQGLQEKVHKRINWRPQVLVLYQVGNGADHSGGDGDTNSMLSKTGCHDLLRFYGQMRKGRGMCIASAIVVDGDDKRVAAERSRVAEVMAQESLQGFADVVVAPSFGEGASYAVQLAGIGGLRPNSVLLAWPSNWQGRSDEACEFVRLLQFATNTGKAIMCVKNMSFMPVGERSIPMDGTIDVWWMIHDGGFLLLCAHFLKQHNVWRGCQVRVLLVMEHADDEATETAKSNLRKLLTGHRLLDNVVIEVVVLHDDAMIEPYTYDWTMKVNNRGDDLAATEIGFKRVSRARLSADSLMFLSLSKILFPRALTTSSMEFSRLRSSKTPQVCRTTHRYSSVVSRTPNLSMRTSSGTSNQIFCLTSTTRLRRGGATWIVWRRSTPLAPTLSRATPSRCHQEERRNVVHLLWSILTAHART